MSLFDDVRVGVLGQLHKLLRPVTNTPEAFEQRTREVWGAINDLRAAGDELTGAISGYERDIFRLTKENSEHQRGIDAVLTDGNPANDKSAISLELDKQRNITRIAELTALRDETVANRTELRAAIKQLESKHSEMLDAAERLRMAQSGAVVKNRAARAVEGALEASTAAGGLDVDSLERAIMGEKDVADARFARVIGGLQSGTTDEEAAKLATASAALEQRRAELAAAAIKQAKTDTTA